MRVARRLALGLLFALTTSACGEIDGHGATPGRARSFASVGEAIRVLSAGSDHEGDAALFLMSRSLTESQIQRILPLVAKEAAVDKYLYSATIRSQGWRGVRALVGALSSENRDLRYGAIWALRESGRAHLELTVPALTRQCSSSDRREQLLAVRALAKLLPRESAYLGETLIMLRSAFGAGGRLSTELQETASAIAYGFIRAGVIHELMEIVRVESSPELRATIVRALVSRRDEPTVRAFLIHVAAHDRSQSVRREAQRRPTEIDYQLAGGRGSGSVR